MIDFA
jgi:hypothetical protein